MPGHLEYLLTAHLFNNLSAEGRKRVESHLNECPQCRAQLEELRSTLWALKSAVGTEEDAAEYSFEERRLQWVLETRRARGIGPWLREHRYALGAAASFLVVVACFFWLLFSHTMGRNARSPVGDREMSAWSPVGERGRVAGAPRGAPAPNRATRYGGAEWKRESESRHSRHKEIELEAMAGAAGIGTDIEPASRTDAAKSAEGPPATAEPAPTAVRPAPPPEPGPAEDTLLPAEEGGAAIEVKRAKKLITRLRPDAITPDIPKGTSFDNLSNKNRRQEELLPELSGPAGGAAAKAEVAEADDAIVDFEDIPAEATRTVEDFGDVEFAEDEDITVTFGDDGREDAKPVAKAPAQPGRLLPAVQQRLTETREKLAQRDPAVRETTPAGNGAALNPRTAGLRLDLGKLSTESTLAQEGKATIPSDYFVNSLTFDQNGNLRLELPVQHISGSHGEKEGEAQIQAGFAYQGKPVSTTSARDRSSPDSDRMGRFSVPPAMALRTLRELENLFRGFMYYRALDPNLSFDAFKLRRLPVPAPIVGDEGLGRDGFRARYGSTPFIDTRRDHFSTFGMDVDTASYTYARSTIRTGTLPRPETVRVEEFVNYFPEEYPTDPQTVFSVFCEGGPSPFGEGLELLKIAVRARELRPDERRNAALTFAVDTSGSMASSVGNQGAGAGNQVDISGTSRLALVRDALRTLVAALGPDDRVGIVAYSTHPYLVLPHTAARHRTRILGAIDSLSPGGATNVEAGLDLTYRVADEIFDPKALNRVILCSDGVANVGARGPEEILKKVAFFARRGIYLSCVGFGMGQYNDAMLETLANKGNGNYGYVDDLTEARKIFEEDLPSTLQVLARDAKIQVDFNPQAISHYRLLGYENRDIQDKDFRNDKVDAGEVGPGTTVTVLYEIRRHANPQGDIGRIYLRYHDTGTQRVEEVNYPLSPGVITTRLSETSDWFRFVAAVAETAELLRGSYWARNGSYGKVLELLATLSPAFRAQPPSKELADLVARAQALTVQRLTMLSGRHVQKGG